MRNTKPRVECWQQESGKVSDLCELMENMPLDGLLFIMGRTRNEDLRKNISRYVTSWQRIKVDISGADLLNMGLEPGPIFGQIMRKVKAAKLDDIATTPQSQRMLAKTLALQLSSTKEDF